MPKAVINDQYINYEIAGVRDFKLRTPALLLHGNGESMKVFAGLVSILASSRGFVLMDSRYQGGSSPAVEGLVPHISYELMADDALKLMEDELGVAEYDIIGSSDASIKNAVPTDLSRILNKAPIERIYANGSTAEKLYLKYQQPLTGRDITRLPSTSPANAAWSAARLAEQWRLDLLETA